MMLGVGKLFTTLFALFEMVLSDVAIVTQDFVENQGTRV